MKCYTIFETPPFGHSVSMRPVTHNCSQSEMENYVCDVLHWLRLITAATTTYFKRPGANIQIAFGNNAVNACEHLMQFRK